MLIYKNSKYWVPTDVWQEVERSIPPAERPEAKKKLNWWVYTAGEHRSINWGGTTRRYPDKQSLVDALLGETRAQANYDLETSLARTLYYVGNPTVTAYLHAVMKDVADWVDSRPNASALWTAIDASYRGVWRRWGATRLVGTRATLRSPYGGLSTFLSLSNPWQASANNFAALRMAALGLLFGVKPASLDYEGFKVQEKKNRGGFEPRTIHDQGKIRPGSTQSLSEVDTWVKQARAALVPLRAGPSQTMSWMFQLVKTCAKGALRNKIAALAWTGFVFFNQNYSWYDSSPHLLHEIMDVAAPYGLVDYNVDEYGKVLKSGPTWDKSI